MIHYDFKTHWMDILLIGFIFLLSLLYIMIASRRSFNFDEFQLMYASASLLRGKAYYAENVGSHFPLSNIFVSLLINITGFKITTILLARYFMLVINLITLYYVYCIGRLFWNRKTGLISASLVLSTVIFADKGIEIRHDVFNTLFNTMGCYYALRYLDAKRNRFLLLSGLFLGSAIASTQKAFIWAAGVILGILLFFLKERSYKEIGKVILFYLIIIPMPLIFSVSYLIFTKNEYLSAVIQYAIKNVFFTFAPYTEELYPFPFSKYTLLQQLFFQNQLFYALGFGAIIASVVSYLKTGNRRIVVIIWALVGILFYLTAKRPFYQSFLPTIPPLAIIVGGILIDLEKVLNKWKIEGRVTLIISFVLLLFIWPLQLIFPKSDEEPRIKKQFSNISFCLNNLKKGDKVLCFTQNQIFFDPILKMKDQECGKRIFDYDAECFEQKMIEGQCRVIIDDYRTRLLNREIRDLINENYLATKTGNILIPGFKIESKCLVEKKIWVTGYYYSPSLCLKVNGKKIMNNLFFLEEKRYRFDNQAERPISLVYIFHPNKFKTPILVQ